MGTLGPLLNRSHLSRNGVLLYKQLLRPVMDCVPACRSAARTVVRLQVLQPKCRLATGASWYVSSRHIHDAGVPLFAHHIRALNTRCHSNLVDAGNPLLLQLGRYLRLPRADTLA